MERRTALGIQERLGEALVEGAFISREQLDSALQLGRSTGKKLAEVLIEQQLISPETLSTVLSFQLNVPVIELRQFQVQSEALRLVPENIARERNVLPLSVEADTLRVAMEDPQDLELIDTLSAVTRMRIKPVLPMRGGLREVIDSNYKATARVAQEIREVVRPAAPRVEPMLEPEAVARAPVVRAVEMIVSQAVKDRASDIHIVPREDSLKVFYRIDGILHEAVTLPLGIRDALISRIKVLANMNIAERRRPQDGQFSHTVEDKEIDFRVATGETRQGEMIVMRVLDKSMSFLELSGLGMQPGALQTYHKLLQAPFGMVLISGPTGSGKTTSLYASINELTQVGGRNIMTIEDPVEYRFEQINQIQVNRQAEITFAVGLRAIMRLDPDIIMVGEIRDVETANIAIQAALTGHLVLTSIHANDATGAIIRLIDMGVEPFMATSAIIGSVAQRLVRRVCPYCRAIVTAPADEAMAYQSEMGEVRTDFYTGRGCNFCSQTGFQGRVGVFEVLPLTDKVRALVAKKASAGEIKEEAVKEGMITLRRDGMLKAKDGVTAPREIIRSAFTID